MKLGILLVHGIGAETPEWAGEILPKLQQAILSEARQLLPNDPPKCFDDVAVIETVYWAGPLNAKQLLLEERLKRVPETRWFTLRLWSRRQEYEFVSRSVADVIAYLQTDAEALVHAEMARALDRLVERAGAGGKMPLTIVSHSLGTVISSDFIYDQTKRRRLEGKQGFHEKAQLENFFTVGSPLPLFSIKYGGPDAFKSPISVETPRGRWVNVFDVEDPIGMPLKVLNEAYDRVVLKDVRVNAGCYLISHHRYFRNAETLRIIGRKAALDWAVLNGRLPPDQAAQLYRRYDESAET